ncbi:hypothetical protein L6R53_00120 [Myxococcota bacterium]|nr:hypothetical protein [Myxococcota bacterium]
MHRSSLLFLAWLAAGCAAPTMMAAHSLPAGEVQVGVGGYGRYSQVDAALVGADGQVYGAEPTLSPPSDPTHANIELRAGLGHGLELGTRGLPALSATDLKWSFLDERRHRSPLSLALDLEVGLDRYLAVRPRLGLLASSTLPLSDKVALVPAAGAWAGTGGFGYRVRLDPALQVGSSPATLLLSTTSAGVATPVGLALPVRAYEQVALAPWVAWVGWWAFDPVVRAVDCDQCSAGVQSLEPVHGSFLWVGLRVQPWLDPARASVATGEVAP